VTDHARTSCYSVEPVFSLKRFNFAESTSRDVDNTMGRFRPVKTAQFATVQVLSVLTAQAGVKDSPLREHYAARSVFP